VHQWSTEEDGVDEAGQTTQPPLIMAPLSLNADPVGEATDTIVDNGIMSSSRTRAGKSRSGASRRANAANGDSPASGDTAKSEDSEDTGTPADAATATEASAGDIEPAESGVTGEEDTTEAASGTKVPLPAETIGKARARSGGSFGSAVEKSPVDNGRSSEWQGSQPTMSSDDSGWLTDKKAEPADPAAASAATGAASAAPATPTSTKPTASPSASSYSDSGSSYLGSSYAGPGSSYLSSAYAPPADYPGPAPAGAPEATPPVNGEPPRNGFSSGTATVTGAAAGLASSVTSAWQRQRRASVRNPQPRKPTKRQAMLTLARVEPWSVMKFSFVASVVAFIILFVAVAVLYMVLSALGVFDSLQHTVSSITSSQSNSGTDISHWFSASLILGYTAMLGALNIVLITAMATVGSVIYNLIAKTIGGIEVTLRETD
jgi:Transmembrane domain of unknown function (DUF3566)